MVRIHAPELPQDQAWLNTDRPLSLQTLKGRVVLLDFWTYGCINCLHILPDLKYLEQKYKDCLTVIGVHSAKFEQEQAAEHIRQAILRYDIEHPVLVDDNFQVWQQYTVRAWPTLVVIDPQGYVVGTVVGEGKRQVLDDLIAKLVQANRDQINFAELSQTLEKQNTLETPLAFPGKVLADAATDRLFIADTGHHRIVITSLSGAVQETIGNGQASLWDGTFDEAQFAAPQGMAFDPDHQILYVADTENHAIRKLNLQHRTVETLAGTGTQSLILHPHSGKPHEMALNSPWDLEQFHQFLLIAMAGSHQIWALNLKEGQIGTLIGTGAEACVDGDLAVAAFAQPSGISSDGKELFVADSEGSAIRAVELDDSPRVRTVCGSGDLFGFGDRDGQGEAVRLQHCLGVAWRCDNQVWIADTYNHKIKQVDSRTGLCRTVLGNGSAALQDGVAQTASFYEPSGLSLAGNWLYIADTNNHAIRRANLTTLEVETLTFPDLCAPTLCFKPNG